MNEICSVSVTKKIFSLRGIGTGYAMEREMSSDDREMDPRIPYQCSRTLSKSFEDIFMFAMYVYVDLFSFVLRFENDLLGTV